MKPQPREVMGLLDRAIIGALIFLVMLLVGIQAANAASTELIPSIGATRPVEGDNEVTPFFGLALRGSWPDAWGPAIKTELGVAYREDKFNSGDIKVKTWPVTASLWFAPASAFYIGGGAGWYNESIDFSDDLPFENRTTSKLGLHLGGGVGFPITTNVGLDLNARYVFLEEERTDDYEFDPSHWSTALGLAFKF